MKADRILTEIREELSQYGDMLDSDPTEMMPDARLARLIRDLDDYLARGGTPPVAWTEGPDAAGDDDPAADVLAAVRSEVAMTRDNMPEATPADFAADIAQRMVNEFGVKVYPSERI